MIDIKDFLNLRPEDLAQEQFNILKEFAIKRLELVISLMKNNNFKEIRDYTAFSGAGDGYGENNNYISFSDCGISYVDDIIGVIERLECLQEIINKKK